MLTKHDPPFAAQMQVQISEPDVKVHRAHAETALGETHRKTGRRCRFADTTLARRDADHSAALLWVRVGHRGRGSRTTPTEQGCRAGTRCEPRLKQR